MNSLTTLKKIFQQSVKKNSQATFIEIWNGQRYLMFTYDKIANWVKQLGAGLLKVGLKRGEKVALLGENSPGWIVAYLALVCGGWVAVPLDKELTPKELIKQIKRVGAKRIFVSSFLVSKLGSLVGKEKYHVYTFDPFLQDKMGLESLLEKDEKWHQDYLGIQVKPADLASIVFTSGTTGAAKAVMLTHHNFASDVIATCEQIKIHNRDKMLLVLPLHHTFGFTAGFLIPLYKGIPVIMENSKTRVLKAFQEKSPTVFIGVPRIFHVLYSRIENEVKKQGKWDRWVRALELAQKIKQKTRINIGRLLFRRLHKQFGGKLRLLVSGGAYLPPELALKYFVIGFPLIQGWGMSELSPVGCVQPFSSWRFYFTNYYERHVGSIGPPINGVDIELIDVPPKGLYANLGNKEGEMVVSGPIVTPGYYEDEESNKQVFISLNGQRWFRTGDVAKKDSAGNLYITGRSKYVIVTPEGKNVHPEEVEEILNESPLIYESLVLGHKFNQAEQVVAIIVPHAKSLKSYLKERGLEFNWENIYEVMYKEIKQQLKNSASYKCPVDFAVTNYDGEKGEFVGFEKTTTLKIKRELYKFSSFLSYRTLKKGGWKKAIFNLKKGSLKPDC